MTTFVLLLTILAPAWQPVQVDDANLEQDAWNLDGGATSISGRQDRPGWRIERAKSGDTATAACEVAGVQPGPYRLSAWFRPAMRPTPDANFRAGLDVVWLDAGGRRLGESRGPDAAGYRPVYEHAEQTVIAPADTASARLGFGFRTTAVGRCDLTDPVLTAGAGAGSGEVSKLELARTDSIVAPGDSILLRLRGVPEQTVGWQVELRDSTGKLCQELSLKPAEALSLPTDKLPVGEWCQASIEPRNAAGGAIVPPVTVGLLTLPVPTDRSLYTDSPFAILDGHPYLERWIGARWQRPNWTWNERELELARRYGVTPMPMINDVAAVLEGRETMEEYTTFVEASVRKFKGFVKWWQLGNEPPLYQDGMPEKYVAVLRAGYQAIKRADPEATVAMAGITGLNVDPAMIDKALAAGAGDCCDVIDLHLYVPIPQMDALLTRVKDDLKRHGVDKPLISTELTADLGSPLSERATAGHVYKRYALGIAHGMTQIYWFIMRWPNAAVPFNYCGLIDNRNEQPRPGLAAYRRLSDALTGATFAERETVEGGPWRFRFRNGDEAIEVVWTEGAEPVEVALPCGAGEVRLIDVAGRERKMTSAGGLRLTATAEPLLVIAPWGDAKPDDGAQNPGRLTIARGSTLTVSVPASAKLLDAPAGITASASADSWTLTATGDAPLTAEAEVVWAATNQVIRVPLQIVEPWRLALRPAWDDGPQVIAEVERTAASLPAYRLELSCPATDRPRPQRFTLAGPASNEPGRDSYVLPLPTTPDPSAQYRFELSGQMNEVQASIARTMMFVPAHHAESPPTIDGQLDDWPAPRPIRIGLNTGERQDPADGPPTGADDLSAEAAVRWDARALYLAVTVTDDIHRNDSRDGALWDGDGLQIGFTPAPDTVAATMVELGIALTPAGPQVWCWRNGAGKPTGPVQFPHAVIRDATQTRYELAIPWSLLPVDQPDAGSWYGLGILVNEQDTAKRGYYGWQAGIGGDKNPRELGQVVLAE